MPKPNPRPDVDLPAIAKDVRSRTQDGRRPVVVLVGADAVGRQAAAESLAAALDLALHQVDLAAIVGKYIGETETNLRRLFDAADTSDGILFFDEAGALFGKRTETKDSHDRHASVEADFLLERIESFPGLVVLASNRKQDVDAAFLRRLRDIVHVPLSHR